MTWLNFFAGPEDLSSLSERLLAVSSRRLLEVYSEIRASAREFSSAETLMPLGLGHDPHGNGVAVQLALWVPEVMPRPTVRRIEVRGRPFPAGSWRETVEGCGLFWLHAGGLHEDTITASSLGWFTQRSAETKCAVLPNAASVNWPAHEVMVRELQRLIRRELPVARAGGHPVLPGALDRHQRGMRLVTGHGVKREFRVEAA